MCKTFFNPTPALLNRHFHIHLTKEKVKLGEYKQPVQHLGPGTWVSARSRIWRQQLACFQILRAFHDCFFRSFIFIISKGIQCSCRCSLWGHFLLQIAPNISWKGHNMWPGGYLTALFAPSLLAWLRQRTVTLSQNLVCDGHFSVPPWCGPQRKQWYQEGLRIQSMNLGNVSFPIWLCYLVSSILC